MFGFFKSTAVLLSLALVFQQGAPVSRQLSQKKVQNAAAQVSSAAKSSAAKQTSALLQKSYKNSNGSLIVLATDRSVRHTGSVSVKSRTTTVGSVTNHYDVLSMSSKGDTISFRVSGLHPNTETTLEVEEIHNRSGKTFGYSVYVNSSKVYFRTYREASEGANHYFIEVPKKLVKGSTIEVKLVNESSEEISFNRVWGYSSLDTLLSKQGFTSKMGLDLFQPTLKYNDFKADKQTLLSLAKKFTLNNYTVGFGFDIYYMKLTKAELDARVSYLMKLSAATGCPITLSINSWWSGTPSGFDGLGGTWTDILYNQVIYDPLNVNKRGNYQLSTPNIWSNTPWLTMNNEHYNQVRSQKIKDLMAYISKESASLKLQGENLPPVGVYTENEPVYWAYCAYNSSPLGGADFNQSVIDAAARDGVKLNPADGLDTSEKTWLLKNLNNYMSSLGSAMKSGFGYDYVLVNNGKITYPNSQQIENAYTHTFITANYPNWDENNAAWETNIVNSLRFGGEWADTVDSRYLDYIVAYGRYADVNSERSSMSSYRLLKQAYSYGADHVTIYNYDSNDASLAQAYDNIGSSKSSVKSYDKQVLVSSTQGLTPPFTTLPGLVSSSGVRMEALNGDYVVCPDSGSSPGTLTFKVQNSGAFSTGLVVNIEGRILSTLSSKCKIEVYAGSSQDHMQLAGTLTELSGKTDVSDQIDKTSDTAYVTLKLYSTGLADSLMSWTELTKVVFSVPWAQTSGQTDGSVYTNDQLRSRNLLVSTRADDERLLLEYRQKSGADRTYREILKDYNQFNYEQAYQELMKALSETLPAKYAVKKQGDLGKYGIHVTADAAYVTLLQVSSSKVKLSLTVDSGSSDVIRISIPDARGRYSIRSLGSGTYEIQKDRLGKYAAAKGKLSVTLKAAVNAAKTLPENFTAMYKSSADQGIQIMSQDPDIGEYVDAVTVKTAADVKVLRGEEGCADTFLLSVPLDALQYGDKLELTLNSSQEITKIVAHYGEVHGTVVSVKPISIQGTMKNASITIKTSDGETKTFEIGSECTFSTPKATGTNILTADIDNLGFKPGDELGIVYSPYVTAGRNPRALKIFENSDTLISETFEPGTGDWQSRAFSSSNVKVTSLDSNYSEKVLTASDDSKPATITWKLDNLQPDGDTTLEYSGRAIIENPSSVTVRWFVSGDNFNWTSAGEILPDGNEGNFTSTRTISLASQLAGLTTAYIKCEIRSVNNDTWGCLNDVTIKSKAGFRKLASATLSRTSQGLTYVGNEIPVAVNAVYDIGGTAKDYRVSYTSDSPSVTVENGKLIASAPGTAHITAIVTDNVSQIKTNTLTVEVKENILDTVKASIPDTVIQMGDTPQITITPVNADGTEFSSGLCTVTYSSRNNVVKISSDGKITPVRTGDDSITVSVTYNGVTKTAEIPVTVTRAVTLVDETFDNVDYLAKPTPEQIGAFEVGGSVIVDELDPNYHTIKGLTQNGYVVYKIDNAGDYQKLLMSYSGRAILGCTVSVSFSSDNATWTDPENLDFTGGVDTVQSKDITAQISSYKTAYVKIGFTTNPNCYSWAFLNTLSFSGLIKNDGSLQSIEMAQSPQKTTYHTGEAIDLTGAGIRLTYDTGISYTIDVTSDMISGFNSSKAGEQTITVQYGGKTTSFPVTVS